MVFTSRDAGLTVTHQTLGVNDTVTVLPEVLHAVRFQPMPTSCMRIVTSADNNEICAVQFSNTGDADVQVLVALGKPPPETRITPSWEASLSEAQQMPPFPPSCPATLPESLLPLYKSGGKDEL